MAKYSSSISELMREALGNDEKAMVARSEVRKRLGLDDANWTYFSCLYRAKSAGTKRRPVRLHEPGRSTPGTLTAYPVSIAPLEFRQSFEIIDYVGLKNSAEDFGSAAKNVALWVKKMQAGSGSSLTRSSYLSKRLGIPEAQIRIGAKGTDLMMEVPVPGSSGAPVPISIAEAQILQAMESLGRGELGSVIFHDIVSSETEEAIRALWEKSSLLEPSKSYKQVVMESPQMSHFGMSRQAFLPTLEKSGDISFNRTAPGGHALFAVDALRAAYREELRPKVKGQLVSAISNGEDLNSAPDEFMLGYVVKNRVPITLVTTERTPVDLKGGLLSLVVDDDNSVSITVFETAQAEEAGQRELFASLPGIVSTNLTLFNYDVLVPLISKEVAEIGEEEFLNIIAPDVISNAKDQRDSDGVTRMYIQLEGAMGSTIMNLDRYWRKRYGEPLVHLINVDRMHRSDFFSPIKSAFDYFMQFHSDRFEVDPRTLRLINLRPGESPQVTLRDSATKDKFYQDVENVLEAFQGARIRNLDELVIEGKILAKEVEFRGKVKIIHRGDGQANLAQYLNKAGATLENAKLEIGTEGEIIQKSA